MLYEELVFNLLLMPVVFIALKILQFCDLVNLSFFYFYHPTVRNFWLHILSI